MTKKKNSGLDPEIEGHRKNMPEERGSFGKNIRYLSQTLYKWLYFEIVKQWMKTLLADFDVKYCGLPFEFSRGVGTD